MVSPSQFRGFSQWDGLHGTWLAGVKWEPPFSKGKESLCSGACGAHWQGFKLDVKGEGEHTKLACDKLWDDTQ